MKFTPLIGSEFIDYIFITKILCIFFFYFFHLGTTKYFMFYGINKSCAFSSGILFSRNSFKISKSIFITWEKLLKVMVTLKFTCHYCTWIFAFVFSQKIRFPCGGDNSFSRSMQRFSLSLILQPVELSLEEFYLSL